MPGQCNFQNLAVGWQKTLLESEALGKQERKQGVGAFGVSRVKRFPQK